MQRPSGPVLAALVACVVALTSLAFDSPTRGERPIAFVGSRHGKPRPSPSVPLRIGLVANTLDAGTDMYAQQAQVRQSGARWLREEFRWNEVEPRRGTLHWGRIDRVMRRAAARRLRVLPLLIGTPRWAATSTLELPARPRGFARFTARVARRYGPGGTFWRGRHRRQRRLAPQVFEVWNEPFIPAFSAGRVSARRYARLFCAAARAGRRANARTRYLVAVETTYVSADGRPRDWVGDLLRAVPRLRRCAYGLAMHPYTVTESPTEYTRGAAQEQFLRIRDVRRTWGGSPRVWITELGWSTCPEGTGCVSEADQARYLREAFDIVRSQRLGVQAMFTYRLRDLDPGNPRDREQWFGLLRHDGTPKPAWTVLQTIAEAAP
jgi:hypothetical protein